MFQGNTNWLSKNVWNVVSGSEDREVDKTIL